MTYPRNGLVTLKLTSYIVNVVVSFALYKELSSIVCRESKKEYEFEQKRLKRQETKEKVSMEKTIEMSKHEVVQLQEQKNTEQEKMHMVCETNKLQISVHVLLS